MKVARIYLRVSTDEAEKIDRISRLPLAEAEQLAGSIRAKGARLAVPGLVDLSDFAAEADGVAKIVLESVQELLLKLALQMARDDYETRRAGGGPWRAHYHSDPHQSLRTSTRKLAAWLCLLVT
jgi:hypothetical protein